MKTIIVRIRGKHIKFTLSTSQASDLDSKFARTYSDDVDLSHGARPAWGIPNRPGQRDDDNRWMQTTVSSLLLV